MRHLLLISALALMLLAGCRHTATDPGIRHAEELVDSLPEQALTILDSIPAGTLTGHNLFLHRYLTLKASDKLFITPSSDSLLLPVLDYARSHRSSLNYPEVLYYAGRTYDDLGDYPTALEYYYSSLDELPENQDLKLRAKILSNIGYIHTNTCLYDEGIKAFSEAIRLDSICCDTLNTLYDFVNLCNLYVRSGMLDNAELVAKHITRLSGDSYSEIRAYQNIVMAKIKLYRHEYDSARMMIGNNINNVNPIDRNFAMSIAAEAFYYSGEMDSAYFYCSKLIESGDQQGKSKAYTLLLSDGLRNRIPNDSISPYIRNHNRIIVDILDCNSKKETLLQTTHHNYNHHMKERLTAEMRALRTSRYLNMVIVVIFIISFILFIIVVKSHRQKIRIIAFQKDIATLNNKLHEFKDAEAKQSENRNKVSIETILKQIESGDDSFDDSNINQLSIIESEAYKRIIGSINNNKGINIDSHIWKDLEEAILIDNEMFLTNLTLLLNRPLKDIEYCIVLMLKCGISVSDIAIVLKRNKGTISYHRKEMGKSVFKKPVPASYIDPVIKIL